MHFLFTSDYLDYRNIGGSGRVILEVADRLAARGHRISVVSGAPEAEECVLDRPGGQLHYVSFPYEVGGGRGLRFYWKARRAIREAAARVSRPDVVIHNQPLCADAIGDLGVPALYVFHSPWPLEYLADRFGEESLERLSEHGARVRLAVTLRRRIERRALSRCAGLVTLSETMRDHAQSIHGVRPERIVVHPGGIDVDRFGAVSEEERGRLRARWGIAPDELLLTTVRRMVPRTGVDILLRAFAALRSSLPHARLLVAGRGAQLEELQALGRQLLGADDALRFLGYVDDTELPGLYGASDLAIVPTRALEGFGLATLEALACGTPVVATPVGGTVEILRNFEPGLLAEAPHPDALAAVIREWGLAPERRAEIRSRAREFVCENYSWERMAAGIEGRAEEIVEQSAGSLTLASPPSAS